MKTQISVLFSKINEYSRDREVVSVILYITAVKVGTLEIVHILIEVVRNYVIDMQNFGKRLEVKGFP